MTSAPSPASVQAFAAHALPEIVSTMVSERGRVAAAQVLGTALVHDLCLPSVELCHRTAQAEGLFFVGSPPANRPVVLAIDSPSGQFRLSAGFDDADHQMWLAPILRASLALVDLDPDRPSQPAKAADKRPPDLPSPRTLDKRVDEIYSQARRIAAGDIAVLIRGSSGSGKEVLSSFVHQASPRATKAYLALNCAALPRDLLEAELFGVERGVATGVEPRPGMFERAHGGTLLLDEIGDMAADTQAKILRVMQAREVRRLGASKSKPADVRLIAATNRDLESMIETGAFRRDLYHRLSGWEVVLPPLAERRDDIVNLAVFFLDRELGRRGIRSAGISRAAASALVDAPWPGNIRQLERQMVRAAFFLDEGQVLDVEHLPPAPAPADDETSFSLEEHLDQVERRAIEQALSVCGGDIEAAAKRLDVGRSTIYRRIKQLGIGAED